MPLTDDGWEALSNAYNAWIDDVANLLEGLADAAQVAERSVEGAPLARGVVRDLRRRIRAALGEAVQRTNDLTIRIAGLLGRD